MAQLAIKGHPKRRREVIEILEMLGGYNIRNWIGDDDFSMYFINEDGNIICSGIDCSIRNVFTLEEFLEKFPYKVWDKVIIKGLPEYPKSIHFMKWFDDNIHYSFDNETWFLPSALNPYKEETMERIIKIDIPKGYGFEGVDDDKQQVVFEKIGCQYPNTYEECCNVIGCDSKMVLGTMPVRYNTLVKLEKLLICRDAYWKIAGEQMGLRKPWTPDWDTEGDIKYVIEVYRNNVRKNSQGYSNTILSFPTSEMRDTFYDNFKKLIEQCKEFL